MISDRQSRSSLDGGAMNVDSTEVVIGDEGNVRLARGVCGKPKICFVDHQAHALCLDKISQSSPYSVTDDVVVGVGDGVKSSSPSSSSCPTVSSAAACSFAYSS